MSWWMRLRVASRRIETSPVASAVTNMAVRAMLKTASERSIRGPMLARDSLVEVVKSGTHMRKTGSSATGTLTTSSGVAMTTPPWMDGATLSA